MSRVMKIIGALALSLFAIFALSACNDGKDTSTAGKETQIQQDGYKRLAAEEPAHSMTYPVTRKTINFWIDTWNKPDKLAYVYLMNNNGDLIGFYTLQGPPVSMCTSQTPNYKIITPEIPGDNNVPLSVPAPGVDGVYYSGGECNTYYGKDATSGAFVEYTVGQGINVLLYDAPLPNHPNVVNLGSPGKK